MTALADALHALDADDNCCAIVLGSQGKSFCAGADFSAAPSGGGPMFDNPALYGQGIRLFRTLKPIVAAIQGPAIGAGAGLTLVADFRIACPVSRFSVPFNRMGFHPGSGMSCTLPRLVGPQLAARLFYTGERIGSERMVELGLADELVPDEEARECAQFASQDFVEGVAAAAARCHPVFTGG